MSKDAKKISANLWLSLLWASGAAIYGWLLVGAIHKHRHEEVIWEVPPVAGLGLGGFLFGAGFLISRSVLKEGKTSPAEEAQNQGALTPIIVTLLPALFFVSALATLVLTLATYNGDWVDARQGLATAFASLIAAVGVVVSVAVSYKSSEENRKAQKEIEDEKGRREERKQDAELIKTLNDRLHEIIPRRYGDKPAEVSASYFQLAALYRDWETLAARSPLVEGQKESQQRNILKILFGVYQEDEKEPNTPVADTEVTESTSEESQQKTSGGKSRSQADIRTLNSVIQDIFPPVLQEKPGGGVAEAAIRKDGKYKVFDLSYLDLRGLDFRNRNLNGVIMVGAHMEGASFMDAYLKYNADIRGAYLDGADLRYAQVEGANLDGASLKGARLFMTCLDGASLVGVNLEKSYLWGAHLEGARFFSLVEDKNNPEVRQRVINQLKIARSLPFPESQLYWAHGFDMGLAHQIFHAHQEYWAEKENSQDSEDQS